MWALESGSGWVWDSRQALSLHVDALLSALRGGALRKPQVTSIAGPASNCEMRTRPLRTHVDSLRHEFTGPSPRWRCG